jgi:hypothetical protein
LIDSQSSSDAGNEDGNKNSTPGIHGPTNDNKLLIVRRRLWIHAWDCPEKNRIVFISKAKDNNEDNSKIFVRIQGANLRRFDQYKKWLNLTTTPLWYNCKKCTSKQECIDWMGKHPLPSSAVHNASMELQKFPGSSPI